MAQPSSSHHGERHHRSDRERDRDRERERERERSHHHHRTISSTTLLLVLSLVLAVLAVMLSLPSGSQSTSSSEGSTGVLSYLTPKRTQALIARESAVAQREAEVARREAELLAGAPGGVLPSQSAAVICPACTTPTATITETIAAPVHTIIKEVVKEDSLTPPGWTSPRAEEILERELKIAEREREISKREENVNRREHDASRREAWIMEQLHVLGNDYPPQHVDEEYIYEPPAPKPRKVKYNELPPIVVSETAYETQTMTLVQTQTITVPPPAHTRLAAQPKPEGVTSPPTVSAPRTTAVHVISDVEEDVAHTQTIIRGPRPSRPPSRWLGGW